MSKGGPDTVDILLAGQTGVGRSTLINMISGASDGSTQIAKVSNDVRPCPIETTVYDAQLELGGATLECKLWDTRGLDEAVDHPNLTETVVKLFQGFGLFTKRQDERDLRNLCRARVHVQSDGKQSHSAPTTILIWCIHASKIDVQIHWQHFRKVFDQYCERRVKPVVVITQMTPGFEGEWAKRCRHQLERLGLGIGFDDVLLAVRKYRHISSPEYREDALALKEHIFRLSGGTQDLAV